MNLVEQIFAQAQAGSANGAGFGQFFAEGVSQGQRQQQIDVQKQQLALEIAQAPLKQTLLQQDAQMNALRIQNGLEARQHELEATQAYTGLAAQVSPLLKSGQIDKAQELIGAAVSENGYLAIDGRTKALFDMTTKMQDAKIAVIQAKGAASAKDFTGFPLYKTVKDDQGNDMQVMQKGPNLAWEPVQSNVVSFTAPDGTTFTQRIGPGGGAKSEATNGLQPAVAAEIQRKLIANKQSQANLNESLTAIAPDTVGPIGKMRAKLETVANIIKPGSMDPKATRAQATFARTAQGLYNSLKADSQINKLEAAAMRGIADVGVWDISDPTARAQYEVLQDLTALQSVLLKHQLGRIADDDDLHQMSEAQTERAWLRGDLTDAEVRRWGDLHGVKPAQPPQ